MTIQVAVIVFRLIPTASTLSASTPVSFCSDSLLECWQQRGSQIPASFQRAKDDRQSRVSPDILACLARNSELSTSRLGRGMIVRSLDRSQLANGQGHETGSG